MVQVCCNPGRANILTSSMVKNKNKNRKKQVGTGLTVNEAVDTKVKDFSLVRDEISEFMLKLSYSFYFQVQGVMAATQLTCSV